MLISVGLPVHKSEYLKIAIQSILNQTYRNFELIIVNDSSPDPVANIVNEFKDSRIKYYTNENNIGKINLAACWNITLEKATGQYFVLASDDDYYEPTFLEKMAHKSLQFPKVDIFHCRLKIIDIKGETIDLTQNCSEYEDVFDYMWHRILQERKQMVPEFMFKMSKLNQIGGFYSMPAGWGSDDITSFIMAKENGIVFINEILCNWRISGTNISSSHEFYYQKIIAIIKYRDWIKEFLNTIKIDTSKNIIFLELEKKVGKEFYARLCEMSARFIFYSPFFKLPVNIIICKKKFNVRISNILGSLIESFGRRIKTKI
jgi:glycosyltransferase involved in cell wall biosynthesis